MSGADEAVQAAHDNLTVWQRIRMYAGGADTIMRFQAAVEANYWEKRALAAEAVVVGLRERAERLEEALRKVKAQADAIIAGKDRVYFAAVVEISNRCRAALLVSPHTEEPK